MRILKRRFVLGTALCALIHLPGQVRAQATFVSGLYHINSGRYTECCGFAGSFLFELPDEFQEFVQLTIDQANQRAEMTFLAPNKITIFTGIPWASGREFVFQFRDGIVSSDQVRFISAEAPAPGGGLNSWDYTVQRSGDGLKISGTAVLPQFGADVINRFTHTNIQVTLEVPPFAIEGFERDGDVVRFQFTGPPPYDYTVESAQELPALKWEELGTYRAKLENITVQVTNSVAGARSKFFRVRQEPCFCP